MSEDERSPIGELPVPPARLLEEAPNAWLLANGKGVICFANARAEVMFGYGREELLGHPIEMLVPEQLRALHLEHRARFWENPAQRPMGLGMELSARRKDGSAFAVEISLAPIETAQGVYVTAVVRDITDRIELEQERNELRLQLEMERERDRIGMDLHDGILQEIYAAGLTLELAITDVNEHPQAALEEIERSIDQLHTAVRNIRSYLFDLRPRQISGPLAGALSELVREFHQNTQVEVVDAVPETLRDVESQGADAAYHIVHEALSNVRKHSDASQVSLTAREEAGHVLIEVYDNGRGFDSAAESPQVHRGLRNMAVRALNAGCDLDIQSTPGKGTRITLKVPLSA